jgi:hypothetical protein
MQGFNATLVKDKKRFLSLMDFNRVLCGQRCQSCQARRPSTLRIRFMTGRYRKHDPKGLVPKHAEQVVLTWPYTHEKWEEELFTKNSQYWKEVEKRRANPNVTYFPLYP